MDHYRLLLFLISSGCCGPLCEARRALHPVDGEGGGRDVIVTHLPFSEGTLSQCVQGANGEYSHDYASTRYDLDMDTPNDEDNLLFAPASGTAYVMNDGASGFGVHVNVDLHDGTYLIMGHLKKTFITSGTDVVEGQILGFEGTTGNSQGDHVHFGRHSGSAAESALEGTSIDGLKVHMTDEFAEREDEFLTTDVMCDLAFGHVYRSALLTAHWHPAGTLLKTPWESAVYRATGTGLDAFMNEGAFLSRGYDFRDVVLISDEELACYGAPVPVSDVTRVGALRDSAGTPWLILGAPESETRVRKELPGIGWQGILLSYGIFASSIDDIDRGNDEELLSYPTAGWAEIRDGILLSAEGKSDVYAVAEGIAMPVKDWDTFLFMGFRDRAIVTLPMDEITAITRAVGNCSTDTYCITKDTVVGCGGEEDNHGDTAGDEGETDTVQEVLDSGTGRDSAVGAQAFTLTWTTPGGVTADWITVAGTWTTANGTVIPWDPMLAETLNGTSVSYERRDVEQGDQFRFSMAYGRGGVESWSCLAPYPPGTQEGTVDARVDGVPLPVATTGDPESEGCQLTLVIP